MRALGMRKRVWSGRIVVAIHCVLGGIVEHLLYPNLQSSVDLHHRNQPSLRGHRHHCKNICHDLNLWDAIHRFGDYERGHLVHTELCSCSGVLYSFQDREMMDGIVSKSRNVYRPLPHSCKGHYRDPCCFLIVCFCHETALRTSLRSECEQARSATDGQKVTCWDLRKKRCNIMPIEKWKPCTNVRRDNE